MRAMPELRTLTLMERADGVAQVTMCRPQVSNAFDETMIGELDEVFAQVSQDPAVRVVVLAGAGRNFSAGADLAWMQRASSASHEWNLEDARRFASMLARIAACPKPTLARVQGAALGGGLGLACACDIAIAAQDAFFSASEVRFGILPAVIGPYLVNAVGRRQAVRMALTAMRLEAVEAQELGIVHVVCQPEELDRGVDAAVVELFGGGPQAQREVKALFARLAPGPVDAEVRELTARTISRVRGSDEAREGFAAFLGKRPARWTAR